MPTMSKCFIMFPIISVDLSMKTCGPKEESGFTHAYNHIYYVPYNFSGCVYEDVWP